MTSIVLFGIEKEEIINKRGRKENKNELHKK